MIDPHAPNIVSPNGPQSSEPSATTCSPEASVDAGVDDLPEPSDGQIDAGPLLRLESETTENCGVNPPPTEDSNQPPRLSPLLGTSYSQSGRNAGGSSKKRSPESVRYEKLLRESGPSSGGKSRKPVLIEGRGCYGKLLAVFLLGRVGIAGPKLRELVMTRE